MRGHAELPQPEQIRRRDEDEHRRSRRGDQTNADDRRPGQPQDAVDAVVARTLPCPSGR
jgi:hypothetical protein